jgi:hypothetical protein
MSPDESSLLVHILIKINGNYLLVKTKSTDLHKITNSTEAFKAYMAYSEVVLLKHRINVNARAVQT